MQHKLRIHVVDDDPAILGTAKSLLERAGHAVTVSGSSVDALDEIRSVRPDCVVLDIMMPGLDGLELCRRLRATPALAGLRIVVLSGKAYRADRDRASAVGADGYLVKPIVPERFADDLVRLVSDTMFVRYWGVRGTLPVSGPGSLEFGGNTSCVSLTLPGQRLFVFDAGTGIKRLSSHLLSGRNAPLQGKIFISHPHWDHINALPFFAPLYAHGNEFEILGAPHGATSIRELVSAQMDGVYFPITIKEFCATVRFRDLREGEYEIEDVSVKTMLLSHPGYCLGFRVEHGGRSFCYVTDNELYPPSSAFHSAEYQGRLTDFVREADVLVTDTTYTDGEYGNKQGWGHSCVSQVVDLAHRAEIRQLHIFHHDPDQSDDDISRKHETCVKMLRDRRSGTECVAPRELDEFPI